MEHSFQRQVWSIALPTALQSLVQNSLGIIDQVMIGQLGMTMIAATGFANKYISIYQTIIAAAASGVSIFVAQYAGRNAKVESARLIQVVMKWTFLISILVSILSSILPVMNLYTRDVASQAMDYMRVAIWAIPFQAYTVLYSVPLRCYQHAKEPFYASAIGILANTALNALLIFGFKWGVLGAALATVLSTALSAIIIAYYCSRYLPWLKQKEAVKIQLQSLVKIVVPLVVSDFLWSLGENIYTMVYGHTNLIASAAMTMTIPVVGLYMGLLMGFSQAAGILIGRDLGLNQSNLAMSHSKTILKMAFIGSLILFASLSLLAPLYVRIYHVDANVQTLSIQLLWAFGLMSLVKVQNMVIGGVLRSGGHTGILLILNTFGTWAIGVPLAVAGLFFFKENILWIYLLLSQEEFVRLILCYRLFFKKKWMTRLD